MAIIISTTTTTATTTITMIGKTMNAIISSRMATITMIVFWRC
jgi:hypothetical protein